MLALLVVTGLAGTVNNSALSSRERKQAVMVLKDSRVKLMTATEGLSEKQLHYRPAKEQPSINDLLQQHLAQEQETWSALKEAMQQPINPEKRNEHAAPGPLPDIAPRTGIKARVSSPGAFRASFRLARQRGIKYVRTSTEDFKNHFIPTHAGWVSGYDYVLLAASRSEELVKEITRLSSLPSFPRH